jgi:hypothetical protein
MTILYDLSEYVACFVTPFIVTFVASSRPAAARSSRPAAARSDTQRPPSLSGCDTWQVEDTQRPVRSGALTPSLVSYLPSCTHPLAQVRHHHLCQPLQHGEAVGALPAARSDQVGRGAARANGARGLHVHVLRMSLCPALGFMSCAHLHVFIPSCLAHTFMSCAYLHVLRSSSCLAPTFMSCACLHALRIPSCLAHTFMSCAYLHVLRLYLHALRSSSCLPRACLATGARRLHAQDTPRQGDVLLRQVGHRRRADHASQPRAQRQGLHTRADRHDAQEDAAQVPRRRG